MFAIDVECVATGTDHNTRSVAQIAIVNDRMEIVLVSGLGCWALGVGRLSRGVSGSAGKVKVKAREGAVDFALNRHSPKISAKDTQSCGRGV